MTNKTFADFGIDLGGRSGVEIQIQCPVCSHTRRKAKARCLSVNTIEGIWFCHHCSWAGSLRSGPESQSRPPRRIVRPHYESPTNVPAPLRDWFAKRGISESVIARHGIGLQTAYLPQLEDEAPCIVFPYRRGGAVVNLKFRSLEGKHFRQVKDAEKILYGLDDLTEDWAVIVEGELDKLALEMAGIRNAVSVPDGAPPAGSKPSEAKFEYLASCAAELDKLNKIVLAVDSDPPGKTLEEELARRLGPERCWRVTWPEGCKDANEVLLQHGRETLIRCIQEARPYPLEGVFEVQDFADDVLARYHHGVRGGLSTGWLQLDRHYTVRPGELTVVTGIPSHGKSELLDALAVNLADLHDWRFAVSSPENLPVQQHLAKLAEKYTRKPFREGPTERMSEQELREALAWLQAHFTFIAPDESVTIPALLKAAKGLVTRHGIRGLILDPWNEFDHARPSHTTETEYISQALGQIRRFARAHGVHVWIVAHPQKLYRAGDGTYPVPTPYDISGSAHWRNKADNCLTVWRDVQTDSGEVAVHIQKIRFREIGRVGVVTLHWDRRNGRYEDVTPAGYDTRLGHESALAEVNLEG